MDSLNARVVLVFQSLPENFTVGNDTQRVITCILSPCCPHSAFVTAAFPSSGPKGLYRAVTDPLAEMTIFSWHLKHLA